MGVAHLKIDDGALEGLYDLLLLFIVQLTVLLSLLASLELLQHTFIQTFNLMKLDFDILKLFVL